MFLPAEIVRLDQSIAIICDILIRWGIPFDFCFRANRIQGDPCAVLIFLCAVLQYLQVFRSLFGLAMLKYSFFAPDRKELAFFILP